MARNILTAVIPVAGLATRLRPLTSVVPKALLPLVGPDGRVRPVVHFIAAEAASAGACKVLLVVPPGQQAVFQQYFQSARQAGDNDVPAEIVTIPAEPKGFGHAVLAAEDHVEGQGVLVMLGDHVYLPRPSSQPCAAQVAAAFDRWGGAAMIGVQPVGPQTLPLVGAAAGDVLESRVYRCRDFIEKPTLQQARQRLVTPGLGDDRFLAHCGIYAFSRAIFDCLREVRSGLAGAGELQLADAQSLLLARAAGEYRLVMIDGQALDTGTPAAYAAALRAMMDAGRAGHGSVYSV